jgi:hypothetical protein
MTNNVTKDQLSAHSIMLTGTGIVLGSIMILFAARGDLWLDEIWSLFFAEAAKTPWELLTVYKHDNNHVLNTLFLYFLGNQQHLMLYRTLAILSGIASLLMIRSIALRWGRIESLFAVLLAAASYPLILYFSEARGYAPAMLFGLLSLFIVLKDQDHHRPVNVAFFWIASILGVLSHLTFVIVFLSLALYIVHYEYGSDASLPMRSWRAAQYLLVPAAFIAAFTVFYARNMSIGGGPAVNIFAVVGLGMTTLIGLPQALWYLALPMVLLLVAAIVFFLRNSHSALWSFYGSVLFLSPALMITLFRPDYVHFRYFILCFPFYYLALSFLLAKLYRSKAKAWRPLVFVILGLFVFGHALRIVPLLHDGRGNYRSIVREMANISVANVITVGSDNDFRNKLVLSFYAHFLPNTKTIRYVDQQSWSSTPPEWLIVHSLDESAEPEPWLSAANGRMYRLTKAEKFSGNSGFSWFLYHDSGR